MVMVLVLETMVVQLLVLCNNNFNGALLADTAGTGGSGTAITLTSTTGFPTTGTIAVGK